MCANAKQRAALILRCFTSYDPALLTKSFVTYFRPILEYASCISSPYKFHYIDKIDSVQKRFNKPLKASNLALTRCDYVSFHLILLKWRRLRFDLVMNFVIVHGNNFFNETIPWQKAKSGMSPNIFICARSYSFRNITILNY